jgi:hypothetical protein
MSSNNQVGFKNPPRHTRFKPGQSGNPAGRPRGSRNLRTDLIDELGEEVIMREGDRPVRLTRQRAIVKKLIAAAMAGDVRAITTVANLHGRALGNEPADDPHGAKVDAEFLQDLVDREIERRARAAATGNITETSKTGD